MIKAVVVPLLVAGTGSGCGRLNFATSASDAAANDASADYPTLVMRDTPRAYYRLGDAPGDQLVDSSPNGEHAVVIADGEVAWGRAGALVRESDTALHVHGEGNAGPLGDAWAQFPAVWSTWAGDFTIELFVRPAMPPSGFAHALVVCELHQVNGFRTGWNEDFLPSIWATEAGSTGALDSAVPLVAGEWTHLAFVRQATRVSIFIDGVEVAANDDFAALPPDDLASCGFGAFHGMPSEADFDELAIYDRALSPAEVASHVAAR